MDIDAIRSAVATRLPHHYDPLTVSFYGNAVRATPDGAVIGDDSRCELRISAFDNCLYAVDPKGQLPVRFTNSSLDQFIAFFNTWKQFADKPSRNSALDLRTRLTTLDARALGDVEKWWEPAVEQLEEGRE